MADPVKVRITGSPEKVVRLLVGVARLFSRILVAPAYEEDRSSGSDDRGIAGGEADLGLPGSGWRRTGRPIVRE